MVMRITTEFNGLQGTPYYSTLSYQPPTEDAAAADAAATAQAAFWGACDTVISSGLNWTTGPVVQVINLAGELVDEFVIPGGGIIGAGGDSMNAAPLSTQGLVRWSTGLIVGGRRLRGRTNVPGVTETGTQSGRPTTTYTGVLQAAANDLVAADVGLAVWSRPNDEANPPKGGAAAAVTGASVWDQWAVLRSRRD